VATVRSSPGQVNIVLPGNTQAVTEAPVLARADGYIKKRYADIGDRVQAGQLLAELEAPELDQQVQQVRAALEQSRSELDAASANLEQGKSNEDLARVTASRWNNETGKRPIPGAVQSAIGRRPVARQGCGRGAKQCIGIPGQPRAIDRAARL
jgi:multidrug efflux pump subunit AcrA (membrane-fusion protein)